MVKIKFNFFLRVFMVFLLVLVVSLCIGYFEEEKEIHYESTVVLNSEAEKPVVFIKDIVLGKFREIKELYLREVDFSFSYKYEDNPSYINNTNGWKSEQLKKLVGKEYDIDLKMKVKMGFDSNLIDIEETDNILKIIITKESLIYIFIPDFKDSHFEMSKGVFRKNFTEEDRRVLYEDSINLGKMYATDNIINTWDFEKNITNFMTDLLKDYLNENKVLLIELEN